MGIINVESTLKTNADALIGCITQTETDIDAIRGGVIRLMGELWFCRPENKRMIREGSWVKVTRIEGVGLYIKEVKRKEE